MSHCVFCKKENSAGTLLLPGRILSIGYVTMLERG